MGEHIHSVKFGAGCPIRNAAQQLVDAAKEHGAATGLFNGIRLVADAASTVERIMADYDTLQAAAASAYRKSPEGVAAQVASEKRRSDMQHKHDVLMGRLPSLDFTSDVAVLDWLCEMQEPSDHIGVIVRRETIIAAFARNGFHAGVNCGADFRPENRDNVHRWLVGQALDTLQTCAIHGIVHKFAAEWKAKFVERVTA